LVLLNGNLTTKCHDNTMLCRVGLHESYILHSQVYVFNRTVETVSQSNMQASTLYIVGQHLFLILHHNISVQPEHTLGCTTHVSISTSTVMSCIQSYPCFEATSLRFCLPMKVNSHLVQVDIHVCSHHNTSIQRRRELVSF
jgi:hypothetical protein